MRPMFSRRTGWDLRANRLSRILSEKRAAGTTVLDLTETNPTRVGLRCPEDLLSLLARPSGRDYIPESLGLLSARQAVAADLARGGAPVDPDRIVLSASTSEAYAFLFKLLCDPGDEILVPRPGYPLFEYLGGLEAVTVRGYEVVHDGRWHLDMQGLREAVSERTRAIVVVSPGNPTGAYLSPSERADLESLAAGHDLALVSDEVFADFSFDVGAVPPRPGEDGPALTFTLGGLSKSCGLPQLKLAWTVVSGPEQARAEALVRLEVVADAYLSVSTPVQLATAQILARVEELQAPIRERTARNLGALGRCLGDAPAVSLLEPEGGWSAVLRIPATVSEEERVTTLLEEHDVYVHPGYFFDFPREAYLVVSLLVEPSTFDDGVSRLLSSVVL